MAMEKDPEKSLCFDDFQFFPIARKQLILNLLKSQIFIILQKRLDAMSEQFIRWRELTGRIADKVQEYIDEAGLWADDTFVRVDAETGSVELMENGEPAPECRHVSRFIAIEEGMPIPDIDAIEEFTEAWFDLRRAD